MVLSKHTAMELDRIATKLATGISRAKLANVGDEYYERSSELLFIAGRMEDDPYVTDAFAEKIIHSMKEILKKMDISEYRNKKKTSKPKNKRCVCKKVRK